jgi:hypothetical protein
MGILLVAGGATLLGFILILLIGKGQPVSPAAGDGPGREPGGELAWVRGFGVEGFQRMLLTLFSEMGFHPERSERAEASVDLFASDPTPIRGGRLYVHGVFATPGLPVDADDVRAVLDTARAELVGKAVLVTLGRVSPGARETARGNPVDLLDGEQLARLVQKHLPQAYATKKI